MFDFVEYPMLGGVFIGYGHYHETHRRESVRRWRIESLRLARIQLDRLTFRNEQVAECTDHRGHADLSRQVIGKQGTTAARGSRAQSLAGDSTWTTPIENMERPPQ